MNSEDFSEKLYQRNNIQHMLAAEKLLVFANLFALELKANYLAADIFIITGSYTMISRPACSSHC